MEAFRDEVRKLVWPARLFVVLTVVFGIAAVVTNNLLAIIGTIMIAFIMGSYLVLLVDYLFDQCIFKDQELTTHADWALKRIWAAKEEGRDHSHFDEMRQQDLEDLWILITIKDQLNVLNLLTGRYRRKPNRSTIHD